MFFVSSAARLASVVGAKLLPVLREGLVVHGGNGEPIDYYNTSMNPILKYLTYGFISLVSFILFVSFLCCIDIRRCVLQTSRSR